MSRSPYYPRRRPRFQQTEQKPSTEDVCKDRPIGVAACFVCHVDLPIVVLGSDIFMQAPFRFVCEAPAKGVCPYGFDLETGATA